MDECKHEIIYDVYLDSEASPTHGFYKCIKCGELFCPESIKEDLRTANADLLKENNQLKKVAFSGGAKMAEEIDWLEAANADLTERLAAAEEREKVLVERGTVMATCLHDMVWWSLGNKKKGNAYFCSWCDAEWAREPNNIEHRPDCPINVATAALAGIPVKSEGENKGKAEEDKQ